MGDDATDAAAEAAKFAVAAIATPWLLVAGEQRATVVTATEEAALSVAAAATGLDAAIGVELSLAAAAVAVVAGASEWRVAAG